MTANIFIINYPVNCERYPDLEFKIFLAVLTLSLTLLKPTTEVISWMKGIYFTPDVYKTGWLHVIKRDKLWVLPDRPGMGRAS